ncbi:hypothetical protein CL614_03445 [archaeon]|nr:hypothetical protein [archaeon]
MYAITATAMIIAIIAIFYAIKFALIIVRVQDEIEDAMDILDERYGKINEILQKPLFYDSFEVRQVLQEIRQSQDAILIIANRFTNLDSQKNE